MDARPCGARRGNNKPNKQAWAYLEEGLSAVNTYGNKNSIKAEMFQQLGLEDKLYLLQVGEHCFAVLYLAKIRTCFVADGLNTFREEKITRQLVIARLSQAAHINYLPFYGQKEEDVCVSSVAAIAIEMQRLYKAKEWPTEIKVPALGLERLKKLLHKSRGKKTNEWLPVANINWKVKCSGCGMTFATTNRGAMNIHKCAKSTSD